MQSKKVESGSDSSFENSLEGMLGVENADAADGGQEF